jgi:hypothetical protein
MQLNLLDLELDPQLHNTLSPPAIPKPPTKSPSSASPPSSAPFPALTPSPTPPSRLYTVPAVTDGSRLSPDAVFWELLLVEGRISDGEHRQQEIVQQVEWLHTQQKAIKASIENQKARAMKEIEEYAARVLGNLKAVGGDGSSLVTEAQRAQNAAEEASAEAAENPVILVSKQ